LGIGDWGLGIGPIPNPQSPIPKYYKVYKTINKLTETKVISYSKRNIII